MRGAECCVVRTVDHPKRTWTFLVSDFPMCLAQCSFSLYKTVADHVDRTCPKPPQPCTASVLESLNFQGGGGKGGKSPVGSR